MLLCAGIPAGAPVAQSVEQRTENPRVGGSIPPGGTNTNTFKNEAIACSHALEFFVPSPEATHVVRKLRTETRTSTALFQVLIREVSVAHHHGKRRVPKKFFDDEKVRAGLNKPGGEIVPACT